MDSTRLVESKEQALLTSIYLIQLIAKHHVPGFHLFLESIHITSPHIDFAKQVEEWWTQGSYHVLHQTLQQKAYPDPLYKHPLKKLQGLVQGEMIECLESGYSEMAVQDVSRVLNVPVDEVVKIAHERGWLTRASDRMVLFAGKQARADTDGGITGNGDILQHMLDYTQALETIV